ncbi:MAG: hypothetical protein M1444_00140 [Patescibacteria group bacterium]|nr:hypothetical protein [Patescibacteria group bacterium]
MREMEPVYLEKTSMLITKTATVIDFETSQVDIEKARATLEQFSLEYDPSLVSVAIATKVRLIEGLQSYSSQVMLWRAIWVHESEKPPYDFAICQYSGN